MPIEVLFTKLILVPRMRHWQADDRVAGIMAGENGRMEHLRAPHAAHYCGRQLQRVQTTPRGRAVYHDCPAARAHSEVVPGSTEGCCRAHGGSAEVLRGGQRLHRLQVGVFQRHDVDVSVAAGGGGHGVGRMLCAAEDGELPPELWCIACRGQAVVRHAVQGCAACGSDIVAAGRMHMLPQCIVRVGWETAAADGTVNATANLGRS